MKIAKALLAVAAVALAAGCGTSRLSSGITDEGWVDGEIVFPDAATAVRPNGVFPMADALKGLGTGVTKDQVYALLGPPHFREGVFGVREWDYVFNFRGTAGKVDTCNFKIVFAKDGKGQSFLSSPEICSKALEDFEVKPGEFDQLRGIVTVSDAPMPFELSSDVLFGFGSAELKSDGTVAIVGLAQKLKAAGPLARIRVEGHSDRLGSATANNGMSERRAAAVRDVLVREGLEGAKIESVGRGAAVPIVQCEGTRAALVACLAPNRRVVVTAFGE